MNLIDLQEWFGKIISQPLTPGHHLPEASKKESIRYIAPSPCLEPGKRIEIYYRQYWWRLIKSLQTNFPTLVRCQY